MPNYYNPYGTAVAPYQAYTPNYYNQTALPNYISNGFNSNNTNGNMPQVDGEIGATSFTPPVGCSGPYAMWDMNDNVVYVRMFNPTGPVGPIKKFRLKEEEMGHYLQSGQSGELHVDTSQFVTKSDFDDLKQEIKQMIEDHTASQASVVTGSNNRMQNNQNGGNNVGRQR